MTARGLAALALAAMLLLAGCATDAPAPDQVATVEGDGATAGAPAADRTATVTRVVDGDTVKIEYADGTADTVRLVGVDTPEVHAENDPAEFEGVPETDAGRACLRRHGERASAFATDRLAGATVGLALDPNLDRRGYYGRLLAYVLVDGEPFNRRLVERGLARVYDSDFSRKEVYLDREADARRADRGLWECATDEPPTGTDARTPTAGESGLVVREIVADAPGNDNENLNGEYVRLANAGDESIDLAGWTVRDGAGKTYAFADGTTLAPGEAITLHTGSGTDTATDRYWGRDGAVWNNGGDTVTVRDADGEVVAERSYG